MYVNIAVCDELSKQQKTTQDACRLWPHVLLFHSTFTDVYVLHPLFPFMFLANALPIRLIRPW